MYPKRLPCPENSRMGRLAHGQGRWPRIVWSFHPLILILPAAPSPHTSPVPWDLLQEKCDRGSPEGWDLRSPNEAFRRSCEGCGLCVEVCIFPFTCPVSHKMSYFPLSLPFWYYLLLLIMYACSKTRYYYYAFWKAKCFGKWVSYTGISLFHKWLFL